MQVFQQSLSLHSSDGDTGKVRLGHGQSGLLLKPPVGIGSGMPFGHL